MTHPYRHVPPQESTRWCNLMRVLPRITDNTDNLTKDIADAADFLPVQVAIASQDEPVPFALHHTVQHIRCADSGKYDITHCGVFRMLQNNAVAPALYVRTHTLALGREFHNIALLEQPLKLGNQYFIVFLHSTFLLRPHQGGSLTDNRVCG